MLDRDVLSVAPFGPRSPVVAHAGEAGELESDIGMGGAGAALAIRHDLGIGPQTQLLELHAHLPRGFQLPVGAVARGPIAMDRAGDGTRAAGADALSVVFLVAADIEDLDLRAPDAFDQEGAGGGDFLARLRDEARGPDRGGRVGELFAR